MDTSQKSESWATSGNNEEDILDKQEEEEENGRQVRVDPFSQRTRRWYWSQDSMVAKSDAREGTSGECNSNQTVRVTCTYILCLI